MKVIIAGGRTTRLTKNDVKVLNKLLVQLPITEVVSGVAHGIDEDGEAWAKKHGVPVKQFPANWDRYGKSAGYKRNTQMGDYAQGAILFPGGVGTNHMFDIATKKGLKVFDFRLGSPLEEEENEKENSKPDSTNP
jgi:hypothetical protein